MSIEAIVWVLDHSAAEKAERLVLIVYAEHASKNGSDSYPSTPTVARRARLGESTVRQARDRLLARGELEETGKGPRGERRFRLPMAATNPPAARSVRARPGQVAPHVSTPADPAAPTPAEAAPPAPADPAGPPQTLRPRSSCGAPPQDLAAPPADPAAEPSLEPSRNQNSPKGANATPRTHAPAGPQPREGGSPTPVHERVDHLADDLRAYLQTAIDGIADDAEEARAQRNAPTTSAIAGHLRRFARTSEDAWAAAHATRAIVQSQGRAPNVVALYAQALARGTHA